MFAVADAHCDFLYYMVQKKAEISVEKPGQSMYLPRMVAGNVKLQFFAAWIDTLLMEEPLQQFLLMANAYHEMLDAHSAQLVQFTPDHSPIDRRIATVLTIEGGEALGERAENLRLFKRLGVRAMTLTWNDRNSLAYPATGRKNGGLTAFGKEVVDEMCACAIAVDIAHLSDAGIDDVLQRATRPVFASHSNARAVYAHKRSLTDAHIRVVAQSGGIVCVNYYPPQLNGSDSAGMDDILTHIEHMVEIAGVEHVGLGSDFDGMPVYPRNLSSSADVPNLLEKLLARGYTKSMVERIAYWNLRDYIAKFAE